MSVQKASTEKIASLARIELSPEEAPQIQAEFEKILAYIHQLDEVEIPAGTKPFYGATESTNATREDRVTESASREAILANAPDTDGEFYRVPPVF